jgi:hypothetical protein
MELNNKQKKIDNSQLEAAIKAVRAEENPETRKAFFDAVTKAMYIVPVKLPSVPKLDENGKPVTNEPVQVQISLLQNADKEEVIPCFTNDKEVDTTHASDLFRRILLPYNELVNIILGSQGRIVGMAINPFTETCFVSAKFMQEFKEFNEKNMEENKIKPGTKIKLRTPKYLPVDMLEAAKEYLKGCQNVRKAYIQMMEEPGKEDKYLIAIDMVGDTKYILKDLISVMKPMSFGIELAFVDVKNGLGKKVVQLASPFYDATGADEIDVDDIVDDDPEDGEDN